MLSVNWMPSQFLSLGFDPKAEYQWVTTEKVDILCYCGCRTKNYSIDIITCTVEHQLLNTQIWFWRLFFFQWLIALYSHLYYAILIRFSWFSLYNKVGVNKLVSYPVILYRNLCVMICIWLFWKNDWISIKTMTKICRLNWKKTSPIQST